MHDTNIEKKREYFRSFKCENLTSNHKNRSLVNDFSFKKINNTLESYIKNYAWEEDSSGETRVYLIKDKNDNVALYFSLKCGLVVENGNYEKLSDEHKDFVDNLVAIMSVPNNKDDLDNMYEAGLSLYDTDVLDNLWKIAQNRISVKSESVSIGQLNNTINVPNCISAIELRHLCRNENFIVPFDIGIPLGFGLFWEIIVPLILDITKQIGCKYIYLFAADQTDDKNEHKKLISHYRNNFKFSECEDSIKFVKPEYDNYCYGLIQEVSKLKENRDAIWYSFSDVL